MLARLLFCILLGLSLQGCLTLADLRKKPYASEHPTDVEKARSKQPDPYSIHEPSQEIAFQSFLTQLRRAIDTRDLAQIASMMTPNFAYYMGRTQAEDRTGDGVFQFWDEHGLWPELQMIMKEKFVSNDQFMVAPSQMVYDENYHGYRAGIARINGAWKFAYFVTDPPSK